MNLKLLPAFTLTLALAAMISCEKDPEPIPGIKDTVDLYLDFTLTANVNSTYSLNFKPGDDQSSEASLIYGNSGSQSNDLSFTVGSITRDITISDKLTKITVKLGFYFSPKRVIEIGTDEKCRLLEEESDKYFMPGTYPLCTAWGDDDFPSCLQTTKNQFYFQVEYIDNNSNKKFKSGIQPAPDSYFKINRITKLQFSDTKTSTGNFDWLIEGQFKTTLHAYRPGFPDDPNAESISMDNAHFKLGMMNLCQ